MDNETKKILTDAEKLRLMLEHEGWSVARKMLVEKINHLSLSSSLDKSDKEAMFISMQANDKAAEILFSFLTEDIEGNVRQHINNNILSTKNESYIIRE